MAKSQTLVASKMRTAMGNASAAIKEGFQNGTDPMDVLASNPEAYGQAMAAGVAAAVTNGTYAQAVRDAKSDGTWRKAAEKAARNYAAQAGVAVEEYMKRYPERMAAIESIVKANPAVPGETREARIQRGAKIQLEIGQAMDRLYGRK